MHTCIYTHVSYVYIFIDVCISEYMYIQMCVYLNMCTQTFIYTNMYIYVFICKYAYVCKLTYIHICISLTLATHNLYVYVSV